ncbi:IQ and ubiquitin-like domain-containing protein [Scleropages formosus]|uniref:IQ motif and ubiquitin domain containing n=1 Tax=Scleropages formosus TaxID=113540 RepID=A0A8C9RT75_SCLFO|nr:IQ and ubiquitin-like domain-containing protein [Scleropages formosus]
MSRENEGKTRYSSAEETADNPETGEPKVREEGDAEDPPHKERGVHTADSTATEENEGKTWEPEVRNERSAEDPPHSPAETLEERVVSTGLSFSSITSQEEDEGQTQDSATEETADNPETVEPKVQEERDAEDPPHKERGVHMAGSTATVKVKLLPDGRIVTAAFSTALTIQDLKIYFSKELKIPSDVIEILLYGDAVADHETLISLGVQPHGAVELELRSSDPTGYPIRPLKQQAEYSTQDVITVRVQKDPKSEAFQQVVVEIDRVMQKKAFLGGFRHKISGTEFHHAAVQTLPRRRPDRGVKMFSQWTQTVETKSQAVQLANTTSTQMTKIGCYVSNMEDKVITPGTYITADEYHSKRLKAVIVLQTYVRQWQARRVTDRLRKDKERRVEWVKKEELRKKREKEERLKVEYHRRMNPETKEDFDLLYNAVDKWRQEELERINATLSGPERKAALCALLEQETQFIAYIGQHRFAAAEKNRLRSLQAFLEKCAAPKRWLAFDGKVTLMDTQHTIRARELKELYSSVTAQSVSHEERLRALLSLRNIVKNHDCKLTREIVELIDREMDLLSRSVREANLGGLRTRIATLFLQYIKTPVFNPEVSRLLKVPQDPVQLKQDMFFCLGCGGYRRAADFSLTSNSRTVGRCTHCGQLDNEGRLREDLSLYKDILCRLQQTEIEHSKEAQIPFLLQERDLRYLVDVVWEAQSALSAWNDLHDLVTVRWDRSREWSPWNCILLTEDEATAHLKLENVEQAYGVPFVHSVQHRHTLGRKYFSRIPRMAEMLRQSDTQQVA